MVVGVGIEERQTCIETRKALLVKLVLITLKSDSNLEKDIWK